MRLYLDTEFNGFGGPLISMALVGDGVQWYESQTIDKPIHPWVRQNVVPVLNSLPMRPPIFKHSFLHFMKEFKNPEIICDWFEDAKHFLSLFEGTNYGSSFEYPCKVTLIKTPPQGGPVSATPHNALADALALKEWYEALPHGREP